MDVISLKMSREAWDSRLVRGLQVLPYSHPRIYYLAPSVPYTVVPDVAPSGWTEVPRGCRLPRVLLTTGDLGVWDVQPQKALLPALRPTLSTQGSAEPSLCTTCG